MTDSELEEQGRMRAALESMRQTLDAQDAQIANIRRVQTEHASRLEEGTRLMRDLDTKVSMVIETTKPITEAMEGMQAGIRTIGKIGRAGGKLGEWGWKIGKLGAFAFGIWVFVKAVILGQPIAAAWNDLVRFFAR